MKQRLTPLAVIPLLVALAACGASTSTSSDAPAREAAANSETLEPQADEASSESSPVAGAPSPDRSVPGNTPPGDDPLEAGVKSTNVCVDNQSGETLTVTFTKYDTRQRDTSELRNNVKTCAEGTFRSAPDVAGTVAKAGGGETVSFAAINYAISYPELELLDGLGRCGLSGDFSTGDTRVADDGNLRFTVTRDPDTNWKQFRITVSPSQERVWRGGNCGMPRVV